MLTNPISTEWVQQVPDIGRIEGETTFRLYNSTPYPQGHRSFQWDVLDVRSLALQFGPSNGPCYLMAGLIQTPPTVLESMRSWTNPETDLYIASAGGENLQECMTRVLFIDEDNGVRPNLISQLRIMADLWSSGILVGHFEQFAQLHGLTRLVFYLTEFQDFMTPRATESGFTHTTMPNGEVRYIKELG